MGAAKDVPEGFASEPKKLLNARTGSFSKSSKVGRSPKLDATYSINGSMKGLTDIAGVRVGHVSTTKRSPDALPSCATRSRRRRRHSRMASGTDEISTLDPCMLTRKTRHPVDGGSALAWKPPRGVRRYLEHRGVGVIAGQHVCRLFPRR